MVNRKRLLLILAIVAVVAVGGCVAALFSPPILDSYILRHQVEKIAADRFHVNVKLSSLHLSIFPTLHAEFSGLVLSDPKHNDLPPLIQIAKCSVGASLFSLLERHPHLRTLQMQGLTINVPPRETSQESSSAPKKKFRTNFIIDEVTASDMALNILRKGGGQHLSFALHQLRIDSFQPDKPAAFHASVTNPTPVGQIFTQGQFGPWNADDPSQSPLAGKYTFSNANLATIRGISGTLSSTGSFVGVLDYIQVRGETETPDFEVNISKHRVPLDTEFSAVVDGMNGNTILNTIQIKLIQSNLDAKGDVAKGPLQPGRAVKLNVVANSARVQDLLRVAVDSEKPFLTGAVSLKTQFVIPSRRAKDADITERIGLNGTFGIASARFSEQTIQKKIDALSRRGRGKPDADDGTAVSQLSGIFTLANGVARFSKLTFGVPGAAVALEGTYNLETEELNFRGTLSMKAKLSHTTTGVKSLFLRFIDPLFEKKNAGAVLPIKITGTREHPSFGLDMGRVFARK
jgi:uncharacterized protein involved in outer membrane biogenesis